MEQDIEYRQRTIQEMKADVVPLLQYLPWLEKSAGTSVSSNYDGNAIGQRSISFPVYDGTLLNFVRAAAKSSLMDRNYLYIYTRRGIKTHEDERRMIANATIKDWDILKGILSKYVLGGRTKSYLWNEAAQERIFYLVLKKMKELIEFWDQPMDVG